MSLFPSKVPLIVIPHPLSKRTQKHVEYLCLEIHTSFFHFPLTESPWGLPVVADGPASLAKVVMAELARLKLENKPWPGGKGCSPAEGTGCQRPRAPSLQEGASTVWKSGGLPQERGLCQGGGHRGQSLRALEGAGTWSPEGWPLGTGQGDWEGGFAGPFLHLAPASQLHSLSECSTTVEMPAYRGGKQGLDL